MHKKFKTTIVLGFLIAVMPFLGFPSSMRNTIISFLGVFVAIIGYICLVKIKKIYKDKDKTDEKNDTARQETFVDNENKFVSDITDK